MATTLLGGYPAPPGNKPISIIDVTGPTSYTQVTPGTPPTGGQLVYASQFGLKFIEHMTASGGDSGTYEVLPLLNPLAAGRMASSVILLWKTAATGAEVAGAVNLSARTVRLMAWGSN